MTSIPREDWRVVHERVAAVEDQVQELAIRCQQKLTRQQMKELFRHHERRFLETAGSLLSVVERNRGFGDLLHHDLFGYFSLISLLIQRLTLHPEEAAETLLSMNRRIQIMKHVVQSIQFYVDLEAMTVERICLVRWLQKHQNFFNDTYKSFDPDRKQVIPLVYVDFPTGLKARNFHVDMNQSLVLVLLVNIIRNARDYGRATMREFRLRTVLV